MIVSERSELPGDGPNGRCEMKRVAWIPGAIAGATMLAAGQSALAVELPASATSAGCIACHKIDQKLVGPSWHDIAVRYSGDPAAREALIQKVRMGGKGNWTEVTGGVPMPPYSPRVSDEEIAGLVDFILALE
jgi:cytochrome c